MNSPRIGFLGGGNMARALIGGLLGRGASAAQLTVGEPAAAAREQLARDFKVEVSADNRTAIADCALIILAVKPQEAGNVVRELHAQLQKTRPVLLSIAAGIQIASLRAWAGPDVPIIRTMPNRPALIGAGVSGMYAGPGVSAEQRCLAERTMQAAGRAVWVPRESDLDVVTALSGSGPAYFFLLAELMMQAAIGQGLEADAARQLAVGTLHGAGALAGASDGDLARLRREVTSKGGTTAAALDVFAATDLTGIVDRAMQAATDRSRELAAQFGTSDK
jgi:pyrroline-5-carboxylate reductase